MKSKEKYLERKNINGRASLSCAIKKIDCNVEENHLTSHDCIIKSYSFLLVLVYLANHGNHRYATFHPSSD